MPTSPCSTAMSMFMTSIISTRMKHPYHLEPSIPTRIATSRWCISMRIFRMHTTRATTIHTDVRVVWYKWRQRVAAG